MQTAGTGLWREPTFQPSFRDFSPETGTGRVRCPQRAAEVSWRPGGRRRGEDTPPYQPQVHEEERCEIAGARYCWQPAREHMSPVRLARLGMVWIGLWLTALLPLLATATHAEHSFKPAAPPAYLYTGEQIDPELGMYYLRARYYQPATGRFWTMDSYEGIADKPLTLHKYTYANGSPLNYCDPSGHMSLGSFSVGSLASGLSSLGSRFAALSIKRKMLVTLGGAGLGGFIVYQYDRWRWGDGFAYEIHTEDGQQYGKRSVENANGINILKRDLQAINDIGSPITLLKLFGHGNADDKLGTSDKAQLDFGNTGQESANPNVLTAADLEKYIAGPARCTSGGFGIGSRVELQFCYSIDTASVAIPSFFHRVSQGNAMIFGARANTTARDNSYGGVLEPLVAWEP